MKRLNIKPSSDNLIEQFAHKIRNPMHSMGINLEVIKRELNLPRDHNLAKLKKHLGIVSSELDSMKKIIHDYTEFISKLEDKNRK